LYITVRSGSEGDCIKYCVDRAFVATKNICQPWTDPRTLRRRTTLLDTARTNVFSQQQLSLRRIYAFLWLHLQPPVCLDGIYLCCFSLVFFVFFFCFVVIMKIIIIINKYPKLYTFIVIRRRVWNVTMMHC